jgi:hypothetical protein
MLLVILTHLGAFHGRFPDVVYYFMSDFVSGAVAERSGLGSPSLSCAMMSCFLNCGHVARLLDYSSASKALQCDGAANALYRETGARLWLSRSSRFITSKYRRLCLSAICLNCVMNILLILPVLPRKLLRGQIAIELWLKETTFSIQASYISTSQPSRLRFPPSHCPAL